MASGIINTLRFKTVDFTLPEATIAANSYQEWTGIDISQAGWSPIGLTRVYSNRSSAVLNGFALARSNQTAAVMVRNITNESITLSSASITVLYVQ